MHSEGLVLIKCIAYLLLYRIMGKELCSNWRQLMKSWVSDCFNVSLSHCIVCVCVCVCVWFLFSVCVHVPNAMAARVLHGPQ